MLKLNGISVGVLAPAGVSYSTGKPIFRWTSPISYCFSDKYPQNKKPEHAAYEAHYDKVIAEVEALIADGVGLDHLALTLNALCVIPTLARGIAIKVQISQIFTNSDVFVNLCAKKLMQDT